MKKRLHALIESRYFGAAVLAIIILTAPLKFSNDYQYDIAIKIALNAIVAVGLNLLIGYAGQISLGHAGFFAIGAYASAILTQRYEMHGLVALALGATSAGALAWVVARPILKLTGHCLAMATLGLGIIIAIVINRELEITGGPDGIAVPTLKLLGYKLRDPQIWYWIIAAVLLVVVWLSMHLVRSAFGRGLRALADSQVAAETAGLDTGALKTRVFVLSAVIAAIGGSLFAYAERFVTPAEAGFHRSIELVTMVVVGGMASIFGPVVGAALLTLLPQVLSGFERWHTLIFGVILVSVMIFLPRGLVPSIHQRITDYLAAEPAKAAMNEGSGATELAGGPATVPKEAFAEEASSCVLSGEDAGGVS
ncbi:MAG: branched-chain amino acid ABC transporter permease [Terriglobales bacterium]